jgi:hypothetical protein
VNPATRPLRFSSLRRGVRLWMRQARVTLDVGGLGAAAGVGFGAYGARRAA